MSSSLKIGIVGCGNISQAYLQNAPMFRGFDFSMCADINHQAARQTADRFGLVHASVEDLLSADEVDAILNLTIPAAHFEISSRALANGKHVYTEKPLAARFAEGEALVSLALERNLVIGCAPDTFLGAAGRRARDVLERGVIGRPVLGTATMMAAGPDQWHPDPAFYFKEGAGPVLDMAPYYLSMLIQLLGPVESVVSVSSIGRPERRVLGEGPKKGQSFKVETPSSSLAILTFRNGAIVSLAMSFDVARHSAKPIEIHGTLGSLSLPDPDTFGGLVRVAGMGEEWRDIPTEDDAFGRPNYPSPLDPKGPIDRANYRGLGLADFADAIASNRKPRASGDLALHALEVMGAIISDKGSDGFFAIQTSVEVPQPMSEAEARSYAA